MQESKHDFWSSGCCSRESCCCGRRNLAKAERHRQCTARSGRNGCMRTEFRPNKALCSIAVLGGGILSKRMAAVVMLSASVAACSADSGPKEVGGTAAGAIGGAVIGNAIGGSAGNRLAGTVIGSADFSAIASVPHSTTKTSGAPTRRKCRLLKPAPQARRSLGVIRIPAAMAMSCPGRLMRPTASPAEVTRRRFTSTAIRKPRVEPRAAIRIAPGPW
jgi:hypothetical protein